MLTVSVAGEEAADGEVANVVDDVVEGDPQPWPDDPRERSPALSCLLLGKFTGTGAVTFAVAFPRCEEPPPRAKQDGARGGCSRRKKKHGYWST